MLLAGCAHNPAELPAPLRADLPEICEQVLEPVEAKAFGPDDDAIAAYLQRDAELGLANETIKHGRGCIRDQRHLYAGRGGN